MVSAKFLNFKENRFAILKKSKTRNNETSWN